MALHIAGAIGGAPGSPSARRLLFAWNDMHLNDRHFINAQHRVIVEIGLNHAPAIDRNRIMKHHRQTPDDSALHLRFNRGGINDVSAIKRTNNVVNFQSTRTAVY